MKKKTPAGAEPLAALHQINTIIAIIEREGMKPLNLPTPRVPLCAYYVFFTATLAVSQWD